MTKKINLVATLAKRLLLLSLPVVLALVVARIKTDSAPIPEIKETKVMSRALHFVKKNYVNPQLLDGERLLKKAFREMERGIAPLRIHTTDDSIQIWVGDHKGRIPIAHPIDFDQITSLMKQVLGFLDKNYTGRVEERDREYLALTGIIDGLDPHSNFLPPKIFNEFKIGTKGNFGGLGIVIGIRDGQLTVIAPIEGTPAYEMGIRANDRIMQIGGEAAINMSLTEAVEKLRGPVGSLVSLVIQRTSSAMPVHVTLRRALIQIKSVGATMLPGGKVALLKIKNFQEDTALEVERHLKKIRAQYPRLKGVILDLRNDPGGLLDQSVEVADLFLNSGVIVKTVESAMTKTDQASPGDEFETLPLAVLINEGSASAAEIVAGALQQNDRACVLGNRSFGKGSVQTVYELKDGSALKLTIAKYLTANDYEVQSVGITPDIQLIPITVGNDHVDLFENVKTREADLREQNDEDIAEPAPTLPPSRFQLKYLDKEKPEGTEGDENAGKIILEQDAPVRLAEELLLVKPESGKEGTTHCSDLSNEIAPLLHTWEKAEDLKLEQALQKVNVAWERGKKQGRPQAKISVELQDETGAAVKSLVPGQSGKIQMTVENTGTGPYYRLSAVTQSDDPLFSNMEFPLGRLDPGQKKAWTVPLKVQDMVSERSEPVHFAFHELYDRTPHDETMDLTITVPPNPHFTYHYEVVDGQTKETKGNGNGQPEEGETVGIKITVKNDGDGEGPKPVVNLKNNGGEEVFLEKGRIELAPLPVGQTAEGMLLVRVQPGETKGLNLELSIMDSHRGQELSDRITWDRAAGWSPIPRQEQIPPRLQMSPSAPVLKTTSANYHLEGIATDDEQIQHVFIFVNSEKAFYLPQTSKATSLPFSSTLHLKTGFNVITVVAQDNRDLSAQRQWIVWKK